MKIYIGELTPKEAARMLEAVKTNRPLTREELQTMEGEPVWIAWPDAPEKSRWCLIDGYNGDYLLFRGEYGEHVRWDEMGTVWLAYRSRPEEKEYDEVNNICANQNLSAYGSPVEIDAMCAEWEEWPF